MNPMSPSGYPDWKSLNKANLVRFDVAVHATKSGTKGGGIQVAGVQLGGKTSKEQAAVSRIQFDIPLIIAEHPWQPAQPSLAKMEENPE